MEHVSQRIREMRLQFNNGTGISQTALAKALKVAPNTVSRWETGDYKPKIEDLDNLSKFFGISILEFFPQNVPSQDERVVALLRAAQHLDEEDIAELRRFAEFRKAQKIFKDGKKPTPGRPRKSEALK